MSENILITRPVMVKVRITDKYKKYFAAQLQSTVQKLEQKLQHLEYQVKRITLEMQKQTTAQLKTTYQGIENERLRCLETHQKLVEKIKEIGKLQPGAEIFYCKVESIVEVHIGDDWQQIMNKEIILEDDKVVDIRSTVGKEFIDG